MSKTYYQCRFSQPEGETSRETIGWIEGRGAKVGALVELKGEDGLWRVETVSEGIDLEEFRKRTTASRTKWASLVDV